ncbi:hypothetical protein Marme_3947 [Marinomonas mediterranea MMB-1]|jgi:hypothetical protein|uniref:Uncharacterized protein n=1 Tax=Marinomonas mediterranea (strain ATCC 700492 / JCM 21426 / NBRC 103028 / MMB-1) TaxID=717774 RepID=F2JYM7_MARM1|nr:hypothetical protein Marme_3947 [Marinomonas mediterranea MMB-1]
MPSNPIFYYFLSIYLICYFFAKSLAEKRPKTSLSNRVGLFFVVASCLISSVHYAVFEDGVFRIFSCSFFEFYNDYNIRLFAFIMMILGVIFPMRIFRKNWNK